MTAEQFQNSEERRARLYEIISDPVFVQAVSVLVDELLPDRRNEGVMNPVSGNSGYQQLAGAMVLTRGLDRLTKPYAAPKKLRVKELARTEADLPPED